MNRFLTPAAILFTLVMLWPSAASADRSEVDPAIKSGAAAKKFSAARSKWLDSAISDYSFKISASCFCVPIGEVLVTVHGRKKMASDPDWYGPRSVPALFKVIHGAIREESAMLDVTYDRRTGRPRNISIDRSRQIADEEISYAVKAFRKL